MGDLVREHARDFAFVLRVLDDAPVQIDVPAGQRECVDVTRVHDAEAVLELRPARILGEALSDAVHVIVDFGVTQDRELPLGLRR